MLIQPSRLADQLAGLRAATPSNDGRGMLPAALHALIAAIFARIFDRLEQIILLWQSGLLPHAQSHPEQSAPVQHVSERNAQAQRHPERSEKPKLPAPRPSTEPQRHIAHPHLAAPRTTPVMPAPNQAPIRAPVIPPPSAATSPARPRRARDPPAAPLSRREIPGARSRQRAQIIPIS